MIKENICVGASVAGCIVVMASAIALSAWLFVLGIGLMLGGMAMIA